MTQEIKSTPSEYTTFRTKDMNQAAYLWSLPGVRLEGVEVSSKSQGKNTVHFKFKLPLSEVELRNIMLGYANGEARVDPKIYCAKQVDLRDLLHPALAKNTSKSMNGASE